MRWPSVRGAARVLALAAGLLALALPLTIMAAQGGASPYQWTTSVAGSSQLHGVVWDGSQFVAFGDGGAVFTSPDGQSWSAAKSGTDKALQAAAWSGKNLVAVGSEGLLLQSADAKAWSVKAHGLPAAASAVAYGQLKADKGLFVAVGPQGLLLTSHNGSAWKHRVSGTAQNLNAVTYGDGLFVAVGDAGAIITSADGKQWSPASGASASLQGVAFGNGLYVAVGQNGALFTSADGRVWTAAQDPQQESLNAVAFTGIGFVAVGQGGGIVRSADGQSWAAEQSPLSTWLHGVAYGQSHVVAVGDGGIVVLAVTPYYIGGVVTVQTSGQPIAGVTLSAAGVANPGPYTATSSATGSYQINNLPNNDTYTVTPTGGAGWTFTPATASVPIAGATATQNFVVTANTITARVTNSTGAPITPTITATGGGNTFTVTAAAPLANSSSQNYIVRVPPGIYTVTASADHTMFTPASIPNVDASAGSPNITATPFVGVAAYLQAGHFYVGDCGAGNTTTPIQGVIVTATDGTNTYTAVSDSAGAFQFFLATGTWTLHFAKGGTMFCPDNGTPNYYTLTVGATDVTSYAWFGQGSYSISGTVTIGGGVAPLKGATMTLGGDATATTTTNTNGYYIFNYLSAGTYTVTPSYTPSLIFSPASSGTLTLGPSQTNINFDASTPIFTGKVTDSATLLGILGVTITADDGNGHVFTAATLSNGTYKLPVIPGTYTLTPTAPAGTTYTFNPASLSPAIDTGTLANQNFTATQIFPVSGYVYVGPATTTGIPGVTITATINSVLYDTQTTDANGHFSFNLPEGVANQVTFNLSKAGFTFTNNPFPYTVSGAYSGLVFYGSESYSVTGTVMLGSAGLQNVKVTLTPGGLNALTDPSGSF
ncbi:MAG: carboxypeptidase regulatory-like domain-containing protein, partial [Acidobacteriota bacterium]